MHVGGFRRFQAVQGSSRGLGTQGPGVLGAPAKTSTHCTKNEPCRSLESWARLKFHAGWSGWTRPVCKGVEGFKRDMNGEFSFPGCLAQPTRAAAPVQPPTVGRLVGVSTEGRS